MQLLAMVSAIISVISCYKTLEQRRETSVLWLLKTKGLVLGDSAKRKTIRFDSILWQCLLFVSVCLNPFASPYDFVNSGYANSVCCINFFVHIYRMLNAGFFCTKNSDVVYQKICIVSKQESNVSCVTNAYTQLW